MDGRFKETAWDEKSVRDSEGGEEEIGSNSDEVPWDADLEEELAGVEEQLAERQATLREVKETERRLRAQLVCTERNVQKSLEVVATLEETLHVAESGGTIEALPHCVPRVPKGPMPHQSLGSWTLSATGTELAQARMALGFGGTSAWDDVSLRGHAERAEVDAFATGAGA